MLLLKALAEIRKTIPTPMTDVIDAACLEMQLLPLPNCQRANAFQRNASNIPANFVKLSQTAGFSRLENRPAVSIRLCRVFQISLHEFGGDDGARTRDLVVANHALSQLSYIPVYSRCIPLSGRTWIRTKDLSFIRAAL